MSPLTNRRFRFWLALTALTAAGAIILASWALYARFEQSNDQRTANQRTWHSVICQIETAIAKEPTLKPAKREQALRFYDRLLVQDVQTAGCGLTERNAP